MVFYERKLLKGSVVSFKEMENLYAKIFGNVIYTSDDLMCNFEVCLQRARVTETGELDYGQIFIESATISKR